MKSKDYNQGWEDAVKESFDYWSDWLLKQKYKLDDNHNFYKTKELLDYAKHMNDVYDAYNDLLNYIGHMNNVYKHLK